MSHHLLMAAMAAQTPATATPGEPAPGGLVYAVEAEGANQYPFASQDMNATHPTIYVEPYSGGLRSDPINRVNGRAVKSSLSNRFHRWWSQTRIGGPGQDLKIEILLRATTIQPDSGSIRNGVKFWMKWPKLNQINSTNPASAVGGSPEPASLIVFLATNGYKEISKNPWENPYDFMGSKSKQTPIGQDILYTITMEWLESPRRMRVRLWDTADTSGTPYLESIDYNIGDGDPSGIGTWRPGFVGLRADSAAYEFDYFRVSALHGGELPPAQQPLTAEPAALFGTPASPTQIDWSHPAYAGATSYDRELTPAGGQATVTGGHSETAWASTGLQPSTQYTARYRGRNALGPSPWSAPEVVSTPALPAPDPQDPDGGQVYLSWTDDFEDGIDPAVWTLINATTQAGRLVLGSGQQVISIPESFTGKATSFHLVGATNVPATQYLYSVRQDAQNQYEWLVYQGTLRVRRWVGNIITTLLTIPLDLNAHKVLRIKEDAGQIIFDTWDGAAWTTRYSEANQINLTAATVRIWVWDGVEGNFVIDNINQPVTGEEIEGGGANGSFSRLSVVGKHMVNAEGEPMVLRGANMMRREWDNNLNWERVAVPALASQWGGNVVHTGFASDPVRAGDATYLANLDELVQVCEDNHVYLVLSFRTYSRNTGMPVGIPDSRAEQALGILAGRYKERGHVMFGAQVETNLTVYPGTWAECLPYFTRCVDAVRTAAAPHEPIVMSSGPAWGRMINGAVTAPIPRSNVVYKTHPYGQQESFRGWFLDAVDAGLPVWIGECGATHDETHGFEDDQLALLAICREHDLGWAAWVFDDEGGPILESPRGAFQPNAVGQKFFDELQIPVVVEEEPPPPEPDEPNPDYATPQNDYDAAGYVLRSADITDSGDQTTLQVGTTISEYVSQTQNLTGKGIYLEDVDCPTVVTTNAQYLHSLRLSGSVWVEWMVYNNTLRARSNLNFQLTNVAYDPVAHRHRQIRHDDATNEFVWETSSDGLTWVERLREAAHFDPSAANWRLWIHNTDAGNAGQAWTVAHVNDPPEA